ncbi:MAG: glucose 1-dehydrogenase [Rhodospirillales bacterium]|nr:glucose 1-dehydrogenase [Rhodospirillales bacterium]
MVSNALFDLTGKVAVVTGAGRGIGRAIAGALAEAGARVALVGRDAARLAEAARQLPHGAFAAAADIADEAAVIGLRDVVLGRAGRIDVLVNNAGVNPIYAGIEKTSLADWQNIIGVNLSGVFLCCKYLGGAMGEGGAIVNVSSVAGHVGLRRSVPYCASKGGVELMSKALALDWAKRGVRVNCLAPGYVDTDLTHGLITHDTLAETYRAHIPMGRFGVPRDMAGAALFLASPASAYMTGQSLIVDGGWTAD